MLPPLATTTDGPVAWGYNRTVPLPTGDDAVATYYPQTDLLYLRAPDADVDEWAVAEPTTWSLEAIADETDSPAAAPEDLTLTDVFAALDRDVDATVAHEIGHAVLSKRTPQQNPSLMLTLVQNGVFGRTVSQPHHERDELRRMGLALAAGEAGIAHTQNVAAPIHEAMASITQACLADGSTAAALRSRLDTLATELGGPTGWTLSHPGYGPFAHGDDGTESWPQYLRSYELSVLAAVQPLFSAFSDAVVYALLTAAATASIRAPLVDANQLADEQEVVVPTIVFVDAIAQLTTGARLYQDLYDAGVSASHLASVFEESVGTGGAGVDQAGETLNEAYATSIESADVTHAEELLTHTTATYRRASVPSFILVEDPATETVKLHVLDEGVPLSHLTMTLLRVTYLQSLYVGRPRFLDESYTPLLRTLIANSGGLPDDPERYLRRIIYLTTRTADQLSRETFSQTVRAQYATLGSTSMGWRRLKSELATAITPDPNTTTPTYDSGMPLTQFLPAAAASYFEGCLLLDALATYTDYASYAVTHDTRETFGILIHILTQFAATSPATPRLKSLYAAVAAWAHDQPEAPNATARVVGTALARLSTLPSTEATAWRRRLYADYREGAIPGEDDPPIRPLMATGLAQIVQTDRTDSESSITEAISAVLSLPIAAETEHSQRVTPIARGVADAIEIVCDRTAEASDRRQQQIRALRDGLLETAQQSGPQLAPAAWVSIAAMGATTVAGRGPPATFRDEYTTFRRLARAVIENTSAEWRQFYKQVATGLVRDCPPSTVAAWAEVETTILTVGQPDTGAAPAADHPNRLAVFVSHLLNSLAATSPYETVASVAIQLRNLAITHLSWDHLIPILRRPIKTQARHGDVSSDLDGWRQFTAEAFTGDPSATQSGQVFVSLYGSLLAWHITNEQTEPDGELLAALVADMRQVVNTTSLSADSLIGALSFATVTVARDGDRTEPATVTWRNWLQQTAGQVAAESDRTAALVDEYRTQLIKYHALFDEPAAATTSLRHIVTEGPPDHRSASPTRLAAVFGAGMAEIGHYAVQFDEGDLIVWMDSAYDATEQHARHIPDQGPFLARALSAFVQQLLQLQRQTPTAPTDALTLATTYASQTASQSQLEELPAAVWVYTTARLERDAEGGRRTRLLRTLRHTAPARVAPASWDAFMTQVERYEHRPVGDIRSAIEMLGPVLDDAWTTRLPRLEPMNET